MARAAGSDADVVIVGYGPVGQALAALLGRAGHRVLVFERFAEIYGLPRAVHLDHEIMRLLQSLGLADVLADEMIALDSYQWFGADGDPLLRFDLRGTAASGWRPSYMFFQPELEAALDRAGCSSPNVTVERGWAAEGLRDLGERAELTVRRCAPDGENRTVRAQWVVGADGANSFVREVSGIARRDLGFQERWVVVDVEPDDMSRLAYLPTACQWCDPARPTTQMQSGPRHRRWEFMLLPGEQSSDFEDPERVWSLLEPWYRPQDGPITRRAVYEFRSMLVERMRKGRVLVVGDAAHLTPPFLGQGLGAGLRDAANLAWKLDLVLRGLARDDLLDTIDEERLPQTEAIIRLAIELGRILCQLDPQAAAERDAMVRGAPQMPRPELPSLDGGATRRGEDPLAGALSVQGNVAEGPFDDVVGRGFQLIVAGGDPVAQLSARQRALVEALDIKVASLDDLCDDDNRLTAWLAQHGVYAVLVRPDFYVFGSAPSAAEVPALLDDLAISLSLTSRPTTAGAVS